MLFAARIVLDELEASRRLASFDFWEGRLEAEMVACAPSILSGGRGQGCLLAPSLVAPGCKANCLLISSLDKLHDLVTYCPGHHHLQVDAPSHSPDPLLLPLPQLSIPVHLGALLQLLEYSATKRKSATSCFSHSARSLDQWQRWRVVRTLVSWTSSMRTPKNWSTRQAPLRKSPSRGRWVCSPVSFGLGQFMT